jgi:hypothetical protein
MGLPGQVLLAPVPVILNFFNGYNKKNPFGHAKWISKRGGF